MQGDTMRLTPPASVSGQPFLEPVTRALDIAIAALALVVLAPLLVVVVVLVLTTSRGPALFRQVRVGHLGRPFVMYKFRTMRVGCDDRIHREYVTSMLGGWDPRPCRSNGLFKLERDPRVTPVGGLLRRTSLDELPQLLNVLRGEMSLVGPRPALGWEVPLYAPHHRRRFEVRPGITGLWQVRGRSRLSMLEALDLDVEYVTRRSLRLYLSILAMTVPVVLRGGAR
jgi:lipopolysaccharide/colanic/teichoic acid biosynthesis glycosyltransferase